MSTSTGGSSPPVPGSADFVPSTEEAPSAGGKAAVDAPGEGSSGSGADWLRAEIRRRMAANPPTPGGRHARRAGKGTGTTTQWTPGDGSVTATAVTRLNIVTARMPGGADEQQRFTARGPDGTLLWSRSIPTASPVTGEISQPRTPAALFQEADTAAAEPQPSSSDGDDSAPEQQAPVSKDPPKRVRVVLSERRRSVKPVRTIKEVQEDTAVGELLRSNLIGSQLSIALRFAAIAGLVLGVMPLLFALIPEIARIEVLGLRLPWLILGLLIYPFLFGIGWWHTRTAERVEQSFAEYVQD